MSEQTLPIEVPETGRDIEPVEAVTPDVPETGVVVPDAVKQAEASKRRRRSGLARCVVAAWSGCAPLI